MNCVFAAFYICDCVIKGGCAHFNMHIFSLLTLTSEMHFERFHPEVASCLLSRGKRKYAPLGMRLLWKYIWNYFLVYHFNFTFLLYLQNYKDFETKILDLQLEKYGLSFDIKKCTTSGWALGDENVIGIRSFNRQRMKIKPPQKLTATHTHSIVSVCLAETILNSGLDSHRPRALFV